MELIDKICTVILSISAALTFYKILYKVIGFCARAKRYPKTDKRFRYGVLIAARNEAAVVGNLIDSILAQTYPRELVTVFVVADNCTDETAAICRAHGAVVYERHDPAKARKGWAMQFLTEQIARDYGSDAFDGFFVFDADNLLAPDFIERMNEAFAAGHRVVTSYRNTKNFDTNFISAAYGIHFYHNSMACHRPRSVLGLGTHLTGTGYLFDAKLIADGWHYTNLTEDDELSSSLAAKGIFVGYCEAAEFYDEQPVDFGTVLRQRTRWARGRIVNFFKNGMAVGAGIFRHKSFTCYDLFFHYFPYGLFTWLVGIIYPLVSFVYGFFTPGTEDYSHMLLNIGLLLGSKYFPSLLYGILTVIREHKHIRCGAVKTILYTFLYPWFTLISVYIYIVAVFVNVRWTPIVHNDNRTITDLHTRKDGETP
ncbi:MAG: glycosyltransferase [Ruminococcaceae bacterium]|nr:glycosyltransferase [Oscillospiraceae bacterium]